MDNYGDNEARFKSLIQPIRDLSLNWDIDIAEELGDYLEELDNLHVTLDNGKSNLNFAEAALLIQGSAAVYSKKVEYLHQLVLHALELITSQKTSKAAINNALAKGKAAATASYLEDERILFGTDSQLLLLDDILEEGNNITLANNNNINTKDAKIMRRQSLSGDLSKSSMILMHSILHEDHGSSNLRLSTCRMSMNGAMLIGADIATTADLSMIAKNSNNSTFIAKLDSSVLHITSNYDHDDGGDDGGGNMDMYYDDAPHEDQYPNEPHTTTDGHNSDPLLESIDKRTTRSSSSHDAQQHSSSGNSNKKSASSTFTLLDPHELNNETSKAIKKGSTYRLPASLSSSSKAISSKKATKHPNTTYTPFSRTLASALTSSDPAALDTFLEQLTAASIQTNTLANPEFSKLVLETKRQSRIARLRGRKQTQATDEQYLYQDPLEAAMGAGSSSGAEQFASFPGEGHGTSAGEAGEGQNYDQEEMFWNDADYYNDDDDNNIDPNTIPLPAGESSTGDNYDPHNDNIAEILDKNIRDAKLSSGHCYDPKHPFAMMFDEEEELARRVDDALNDTINNTGTYMYI